MVWQCQVLSPDVYLEDRIYSTSQFGAEYYRFCFIRLFKCCASLSRCVLVVLALADSALKLTLNHLYNYACVDDSTDLMRAITCKP